MDQAQVLEALRAQGEAKRSLPAARRCGDERPKSDKNTERIRCPYCNCLVLRENTADAVEIAIELPALATTTTLSTTAASDEEPSDAPITYNHWWRVPTYTTFDNVSVCRTAGNRKYLACCDCEREIFGVHFIDMEEDKSYYVSVARVGYSDQ